MAGGHVGEFWTTGIGSGLIGFSLFTEGLGLVAADENGPGLERRLRMTETSIIFGIVICPSVDKGGLPKRYSSRRMRSLSLGGLALNSFVANCTGSARPKTSS